MTPMFPSQGTSRQRHRPANNPVVTELIPRRDREHWLTAARHLESIGLPPCVPCSILGYLRKHGVRSAWCNPQAAASQRRDAA